MLIQEALKENGKAWFKEGRDLYARKDGSYVHWYDSLNDNCLGEITLDNLTSDQWQPYHEVKEIRPEKAGELWGFENEMTSDNYITVWVKGGGEIRLIRDTFTHIVPEKVIHNKNGWTRLYPPVEDDSVERIEFEDTAFLEGIVAGSSVFYPTSNLGQFCNAVFKNYCKRPSVKMILEIPKEG
jgi:hypothetical protein